MVLEPAAPRRYSDAVATRDEFAEKLAAATPTPGGGAAAARSGLHASSLLRMVTGITLAKLPSARVEVTAVPAGGPAAREAIERARASAEALGETFERLGEEDMAAFEAYLEAWRLPRTTPEEKSLRLQARQSAAARATDAPLAMLRAARDLLLLCAELLDLSRTTPLKAESDLGAAIELANAAFRVADLNVRVNLKELSEEKRAGAVRERQALEEEVEALHARLRREVLERLAGG
ncbi:MAG TPA: cyclodeaminase/cyclohydrolase family protein [Planctomycetota bacterium]|nr:cyclodeaminase/cyclohydrolase family protein [Planctomycetota bacterium]